MNSWNSQKSADLYGISSWGAGYFGVSPQGTLLVHPHRQTPEKNEGKVASYDISSLVQSLKQRGLELPILLRFDEILADRIRYLQSAFESAILEAGYSGDYRPVYPLKVNQQRHIVESVLAAGEACQLGVQVGSKAELLAVLALHSQPNGLLICSGFKDTEYLELAMLSSKIGKRPIIVIEQPGQLEQAIAVAERLELPIELGVRMRPSVRSLYRDPFIYDRSKFGLGPDEMYALTARLRELGKEKCLKLLHVHLGTQITSIAPIKKFLREASRMYVELAQICPEISFLDVGGGLAVDYDGSNTNFESSMNYSVEEYARDVVYSIEQTCAEVNVKRPTILTESGRALAAHHAVLVMEVVDVSETESVKEKLPDPPSDHSFLTSIQALYSDLDTKDALEVMHDVVAIKEEMLEKFNQGDLDLVERAYVEQSLRNLIAKFKKIAKNIPYVPEEMQTLINSVRDLYFCNFSVFQSLPDSWAVDQLFPVVPVQKLDQRPTRKAILADLSCDSDGCIDRFIDLEDVNPYLMLHKYDSSQPYYVAVCLIGAYQEILGDLHNLFGDTHAIHVNTGMDGEPEFTHLVEGDRIKEVLSYVQFNPADLQERLRRSIEAGLRKNLLTPEDSVRIQKRYKEALDSYTYLVIDRQESPATPS
ncbi:MAG: biosynthetic arginine decarboxylase [Bdellovibrionales bacterium]|nr:biosynthetic arginine decarboxylase [Bdellovibrionales bacterium]